MAHPDDVPNTQPPVAGIWRMNQWIGHFFFSVCVSFCLSNKEDYDALRKINKVASNRIVSIKYATCFKCTSFEQDNNWTQEAQVFCSMLSTQIVKGRPAHQMQDCPVLELQPFSLFAAASRIWKLSGV